MNFYLRLEAFSHYLEIGKTQEDAAAEPQEAEEEQPTLIVDTQYPLAIHDQHRDPIAERLEDWGEE